jgi:hypothetical protein
MELDYSPVPLIREHQNHAPVERLQHGHRFDPFLSFFGSADHYSTFICYVTLKHKKVTRSSNYEDNYEDWNYVY